MDMDIQSNYKSLFTQKTPNNFQEKISLLALASLKGVGYWTLYKLKKEGFSFNSIITSDDGPEVINLLCKFGATIDKTSKDWRETSFQAIGRAEKITQKLNNQKTEIIFADDDRFPESLLDLDDSPEWLFIRGDFSVLKKPSITAVGTRKPSADGEWLSNFVGLSLADWGAPTVSGLANGMDQAIHNFSLRMKVPTIAILGTGIQSDYPKGSNYLIDKIIDHGGTIITEYLPNDSYSGQNFVRRNRLQAALGKVLIPIEWSPKSGTAHTVNYAAQLMRPIAALSLSDWETERVILPKLAEPFSKVFCLPRDQTELNNFVKNSLSKTQKKPIKQMPLI